MERCFKIAKTIIEQIKWSADLNVILSWGISEKKALYFEEKATLGLNVNGFLHQGWIYISYDEGNDTYQIRLLNENNEVKKVVEDVYCDMLGNIIDGLIEYNPNKNTAEEYRKQIINLYH